MPPLPGTFSNLRASHAVLPSLGLSAPAPLASANDLTNANTIDTSLLITSRSIGRPLSREHSSIETLDAPSPLAAAAGGDQAADENLTLEPKVIRPFQPRPGETPRRVEMSASAGYLRRKMSRQFSNLQTSLPLHAFDNTDFEARHYMEWLNMDKPAIHVFKKLVPRIEAVSDSSSVLPASVPVPAHVYFEGNWQSKTAHVTGYDTVKDLWRVEVSNEAETVTVLLPRIFIHFLAEDARVFAHRIAHALHAYREACSLLKLAIFTESMPPLSSSSLAPSTLASIAARATRRLDPRVVTALALNNPKTTPPILTHLRTQCNQAYATATKAMALTRELAHPAQAPKYSYLALTLPESLVDPIASLAHAQQARINKHLLLVTETLGTEPLDKRRAHFAFTSFLTKPAVLTTWRDVRTLCAQVAETAPLLVATATPAANGASTGVIVKTMRIDELEAEQAAHMALQRTWIHSEWAVSVQRTVEQGLAQVGKGWYNTGVSSYEVYAMSRLRGLLTAIRFCMQDAIRSLVMRSLAAYIGMLKGVPGTKPLLHLDLVFRDGAIVYDVPWATVEAALLGLVDKALGVCEGIPDLEPRVLKHLFWATKPVLASPARGEEVVQRTRDTAKQVLDELRQALEAHRRQFDGHLPLLQIQVATFAAEYEAGNKTVADMEADMAKFQWEWEVLDKQLAAPSVVGNIVSVHCDVLRKELKKDLSKVVLEILARRTAKQALAISAQFNKMAARCKEKPVKAEELGELREYVAGVPALVAELQTQMEAMMHDFGVLDKYKYELANDDFKAKWAAYAWPLQMDKLLKQAEENLATDEQNFIRNLQSDQELFKEKLHHLSGVIADFAHHADLARLAEIVAEVQKVGLELKEAQALAQLYNARERLFNMPVTNYDEVMALIKDFDPYKTLWTSAADWIKWKGGWLNGNFLDLVAEEVEKNLMGAWRAMFKTVKTFKHSPGCLAVATQLKDEMDAFKPSLPLIQALRNPGMRDRHWDKLAEMLGTNGIRPTQATTLADLLKMQLMDKMDVLSKVSEEAGKEYAIEAALDKMENEWKSVVLEVLPYRETGTFIMKLADETTRLLDDHLKPFAERITLWESKLRVMQEVLEEWTMCQRQWMYLEPIFGSADIVRQLPQESKRFAAVDKTWRKAMANAQAHPGVVETCSDAKLLDSFREANKLLEMVAKGLSAYLESKRIAFPRFFFLSDDELLQILSQTRDPTAVQPHLRKTFENMTELKFSGKDNLITAMYSSDGECVEFNEPFYPVGNVEDWLLKVEATMKSSLRHVLKMAIADYPVKKREQWVLDWPGQLVIAGSQVYFTQAVTQAIEQGMLREMYASQLQALDGLVSLVRGDLSPIARSSIGALIVIDVHARDLVRQLMENNIDNPNDFEWISQLRYYWEADEDLHVRIVNAHFKYGYEYLGNNGRLVITPLTDRCYLTLTAAMHLGMGGAPAGPAGTGKTETTKDLAKALAKQCVVFNCSDQLDYLAMAKFFKGLSSSGAWACFDEFNRIDIEVLSVIAQQITTIQKAVAAGMSKFVFEGVELKLDPTNAIFITMNPGYAGRTELPDNLKALFRPVAMMIPDYAMIGEISLFSFGFSEAKVLAQKMVATFRLSSEQLSSQDHYDFGMRAVKTVISAAGNLKRQYPDSPEDLLLLRALCDVNVPKFLAEDVPLFHGIISDLFPGIPMPKSDHGALLEALAKVCVKSHLMPEESFLGKCLQMYDTINVRHGMMLVGPTGGGKTSCYRMLRDALGEAGICKVRVDALNPKSITMGQLYGEFDEQTHEWTDGILSSMVRDGAADTSPDRKWYIFDGPVDAMWIETMNTVLDDNKKLCLTSGEIIKLIPTQTLIFEVDNLAHASPATVSRCGMVYMEPGALGLLPLVKRWVSRRALPETISQPLVQLYQKHGFLAIEFTRRSIKEPVATTDGSLLESSLKIVGAMLDKIKTEEDANAPIKHLESIFYFSLVWSAGATADGPSRAKFSAWMQGIISNLPQSGLLHDFRYDLETAKWVPWMEGSGPGRNGMMVATMDTIRHEYLLDLLLHAECPVLCTGPTGTGKTVAVQEKIMRRMAENFSPIIVNFSARTSANQTQDLLDSKMEKRRKGVYGPPLGKKLVIFIDDLNMPQMESTGAQPPIELIRQWMDYGGWFDRKQVGKFMELVDIVFVAAMGPPGGGRNPVTQRLTRHFNLLSFVEMDNASLSHIFTTILSTVTSSHNDFAPDFAKKMVSASIAVYNTLRQELLPTPSKSHYTYNLRDLSKVFQGILMANHKTIESADDFVLLWLHESQRVFADRLVDTNDRTWFRNLIQKTMANHLEMRWEEVVKVEPILFGDYLVPGADPKQYVQVKDLKKLVKLTEEYLEDYNNQVSKPMKLVMFLDAIEHVSRICRILRQPGGNALLLGVGGSGRQSLARLACHMEEYECIQVEISKNYGQNEWKEDLKRVLFRAGMDAQPVVFLYCDTQVFQESCVEDVNNLLNAGDVPNSTQMTIWTNLPGHAPNYQDAGQIATKENMFSTYLNRVRENVHIVFCMSPIGDAFRNRLRMFPSLVNCCTIDWFTMWPEEALRSVAANAMAEVADLGTEVILEGIVTLCVVMHESVRDKCVEFRQQLGRNNYITPRRTSSYSPCASLTQRTATGLDKLLNATKEVQVLQEELEAMQPMLLQTSQETEFAMKKIAADKIKAEEIRTVVQREETEASKKAEETKNIADDAQRDLDEALPALAAALESLNSLSKNDVIEVRSMQRPPEGVKLVMEAVCIMKGLKPKKVDGDKPGKKVDDYWEVGKSMLSEPAKFLDSLMTFDKDNIPEAVVTKIKPYIDNPDFAVEVISKVSKAATSICAWVRAMEKYYWVSRSIEPKRARLKEAQDSLEVTLKTVAELRQKLKEAEININEMEKKYLESVAKKEELGRKVASATSSSVLQNIVGDVLLAAGTIAYLGPFTTEYRQALLKEWGLCLSKLGIPHSPTTSLMEVLGDSSVVRTWEIAGLPKDSLSRENALISFNSRRWSLFIDPQGQANKWVRNMEKDNGLDIIKLSDRDYLRTLENSIRFGKPCLLENVEEKLDAALEPVLLRQTFKQNGNTVIKLGDNVLPYHNDFKLYITTKLPNPHYSPEISAIVTLLNFTLAASGLEDQLLAIVVANERPDLEEAKNQLMLTNAQMKKELQEIEDKILYLLSSVQGSPVDDERLIDTLAASKLTSSEITAKVAQAEITERDIDSTRLGYVPVAVRTRILFFCITEMSRIDPMYQYSLGWFMNIFSSALKMSEKSTDLAQRLSNIIEYFTFSLYSNVCRSLFERHKLLFSFLLGVRILLNDNKVNIDDFKFLVTGSAPTPGGGGASGNGGGGSGGHGGKVQAVLPNPAKEWLTEMSWTDIQTLGHLESYSGIAEDFCLQPNEYRRLFDSPTPHLEPLPGQWDTKLDQFQKLLLYRCICPDRMVAAIQQFVGKTLGDRFIEPQTSEFSALYKESSPWTPLIFVLSPGADPANNLYKFAEEMKFTKKLQSVSLGQGQGPRAEALLREGMEKGLWVLLQNCHLAPSWMPSLDKLVDAITPDKVHRDFRLWLTSMPTPKFPVSILQNGVKMTIEPPNGIKANLLRTYASLNDEFLEDCTKAQEWKKLLFALALFHAILQERRKFGPLGWNISYEFTEGDHRICVRQLQMFLNEYKEIPYKVLNYTTWSVNYGGRVTDDWDRRLIMNILADYYNPQALIDGYKFSPTCDIYSQLPATNINGYRAYIRSLPLNDPTDIFCMHSNANISFAQKQTFTLFETLTTLMPRSGGGKGGSSREEQLVGVCESIVTRVSRPLDVEAVMKKYPTDYKESMSTVLVQEVVRYNRVLKLVHSSLQDLIKACKGVVVMSEQLDAMANSMSVNQVPGNWAARAYPSLKPLGSWVNDLVARIDFLKQWIDHGIPSVFWISGLYFPQAFLTGTMQNYARKYQIPIDKLAYGFHVVKEPWESIKKRPEDGCYIRGLLIEGARWDADAQALAESRPKELYTTWLSFGCCPCKIGQSPKRASTIALSTRRSLGQSHWIKRGVALVCSGNW
ncbi:dynein heavy chain and region D6 of dynein motor-domain-containing protein [Catenaria anguillulae PL171]|uniref:Dynein heavy chain and region D6 of dynein motor-domain-containing protein n=1 Tax=Catenaria anguillulae PL171 TaxID=765915 RepID=A0A1Y2H8L7_9FUNG|nr:dynein heavy chain and region D6 of dynein motor-domain-containing protein [Catenaria anguillulae PL171]